MNFFKLYANFVLAASLLAESIAESALDPVRRTIL